MEYIHTDLGSIHRDLKSENVLLCLENAELRAKVADFGLSRFMPSQTNVKRKSKSSMLSLFSSPNSYLKNSTSRPPHDTLNSLQGDEKSASDSMKFTQGEMTAASGTIAYMAPELLTRVKP